MTAHPAPRLAMAALTVLCAGLAASIPTAAAQGAGLAIDRPAKIVVPRTGGLVSKRVLRVRIKENEPLRKLSASLTSAKGERSNITGRFRSVGDGVWRATLRRGRHFARGSNQLYVRVRTRAGEGDVVSKSFTAAGRRANLVAVRGPRGRIRSAPVGARVKVRRGLLRVRLNGRNVRDAFERRGGSGVHRGQLTVHDGLRFGRNRLVVTAFTGNGRYERVRRTFRVPRRHPLADAGRDRITRVGARLRLNGRRSRPTRRGARLRMRWRIVDRPEGSRPRLRGARRARPRLIADVEGRYTLGLRTREVRARSRRGGRSRSAGPPAEGRAARRRAGTSVDTVTVAAQPNVKPQGVPVETLAHDSSGTPGIRVGDDFHAGESGRSWIQLLILDRRTLAVKESKPFNVSSTAHPLRPFLDAVEDASAGDLVIAAGNGRRVAGGTNWEPMHRALTSIGASYRQGTRRPAFDAGTWSVVGVKGTSPGSAYQLLGRHQGSAQQAGSISGFLRLDSQDNFTFRWAPEDVTFDTQAPGSTATGSVISVNGKDYRSSKLESGESGVQILWFDADTLNLRGRWTYLNEAAENSKCSSSGAPPCLTDFARKDMRSMLDDPDSMLLMTTIGNPNVASAEASWARIASPTGLPAFGVNPQVMLGLNGKGDYSFVGVNGLGRQGPNGGAELSQVLTGMKSPRLSGRLTRNRQGLLVPVGSAPPDPDGDADVLPAGVPGLLAEPDKPFPAFTSSAERAAERYIAGKLSLALDSKFGIRGNYWLDDDIQWGSKRATLQNLQASGCPTAQCRKGFASVRQQLLREFPMVQTVRLYLTGGDQDQLTGILTESMIKGDANFVGISDSIQKSYNIEPSKPLNGSKTYKILEGSMKIAGGVFGASGFGVGAGAMSIMGGVVQIVQAETNKSSGGPAINPLNIFQAKVGTIGQRLTAAWSKSIANLGLVADRLVSDWGRLQRASALIDKPLQDGGWGLDTQAATLMGDTLTLSLRRYLHQALLPVPFQIDNDSADSNFFNKVFPAWIRWPVSRVSKDGSSITSWEWALTNRVSNRVIPPKSLPRMLFGHQGLLNDPGTGPLGFYPAESLAPAQIGSDSSRLTPGFAFDPAFCAVAPCGG